MRGPVSTHRKAANGHISPSRQLRGPSSSRSRVLTFAPPRSSCENSKYQPKSPFIRTDCGCTSRQAPPPPVATFYAGQPTLVNIVHTHACYLINIVLVFEID